MQPNLPQRIYLLSYDLEKNRFDQLSAGYRGQLLRAAALAQLSIDGQVANRDGKLVRTAVAPPDDAFLAGVLDDVPADKPRGWLNLLVRKIVKSEWEVRDQLAQAGVVTDERKKVLGLIPAHKVTPNQPEQVHLLREQARNALFTGGDPAAFSAEDLAAAGIVAAGDVVSVFALKERRAHKAEEKLLTERVDEAFPGLIKGVRGAVAASRTAAAS